MAKVNKMRHFTLRVFVIHQDGSEGSGNVTGFSTRARTPKGLEKPLLATIQRATGNLAQLTARRLGEESVLTVRMSLEEQ